jgi:NAD(P)-dependent dehydrogenase (short-subunit alcohol dehydrogenase family)
VSVEWARFDVRATLVAPGPAAAQDELAAFVAFLASRAGGYYSGCRFDLG